MSADPFWIVWAPSGHRPPRVCHHQRHQAEHEAMRLAKENPGKDFIVMQAAIRFMQPVGLEVEHYDDLTVPF